MCSKRIGLLGGTFDPPHIGHLIAAIHVKAELELDEVRLIVANRPWQKEGSRTITSAERRLAMTSAAAQACEVEGIHASDIELDIGGPSYMVETLERVQADEPGSTFFVIVGADAAGELDTWHKADRLKSLADFVFINRPGYVLPKADGWKFEVVEIPSIDLSSSDLRQMVTDEKSLLFLTPRQVMQDIEALGLYRLDQ